MSNGSEADALFEALFKTQAERIAVTIPKRNASTMAPLSSSQMRLWVINQWAPSSPAYNIVRAFRCSGPLNVPVLEACINHIVMRHDVLRTTFQQQNGQPVQVVTPISALPKMFPGGGVKLPVVDLRDVPASDQESLLQQQLSKRMKTPFDLTRLPLLRPALFHMGKNAYVFLLVIHHMVCDGWSLGVFGRDLAAFYEAFSEGKADPLPMLPIQYGDYTQWHFEQLQGSMMAESLQYWKQRFADNPTEVLLPTDLLREREPDFRGGRYRIVLPPQGLMELKSLGRKEGVTLYMALLAVLQLLLHRYSGQKDILVGTPMAGRNYAQTKNLIGLFVNTLVMRTDVSGEPTFRDLLGRVRETALGAYRHQDVPFEQIAAGFKTVRSPDRHPLLNVMLNVMEPSWHHWQLKDVLMDPLDMTEPLARFPLELYAIESGGTLQLDLVYQKDLFSDPLIMWMGDQLRCLLLQVATSPEKRVGEYSLITSKSRSLLPDPSLLLDEPGQKSVIDRFLDVVRCMPQQIAVRQAEQSWTYGTLAAQSQQLADLLHAYGLQRGDVVAVTGSRHPAIIAAMMGVLMAGGILLTVDENFPGERKQWMLQEASASVLVYVKVGASADSSFRFAASRDFVRVVCFNEAFEVRDNGDAPRPKRTPDFLPNDAAYIFFTSGTTGRPKGVVGSHRGLSHFLNWQQKTFAIGPRDRVAQLTSLSFDPVLRDVFLPLICGAGVCLPCDYDFSNIFSWMENSRVSILHMVPTLAQSWLETIPGGVCLHHVRKIFMAGEPLTESLVKRWRSAFPLSGPIINLYGPTETTLAKCFFQVPATPLPGVQPIGSPIDQTQALIFAENGRPCGIGEPGEIVIRTPFCSLGYIKEDVDTSERFKTNPFRNDKNDRLYHTGDRGRFKPDGTLEYLGRLDDQVKIGGVRIAPVEITALLSRHPGVNNSVVTSRPNEMGQPSLVAYVVPRRCNSLTDQDLRAFLLKQLPAAVVPEAFVYLEELPVTPNGKVDHRLLPLPQPQSKSTVTPAKTPIEKGLADIWARLLKKKAIGVDDDFFQLGGHSLLAVRLITEIRRLFNVALSVKQVFETRTLSGLAVAILAKQIELSGFDDLDHLLGTDPSSDLDG